MSQRAIMHALMLQKAVSRQRLITIGLFRFQISGCKCSKLLSTHATHQQQKKAEVSEHVKPEAGALTTGQKVKQAGKDVSYLGILLLGFGITGTLIWYVADELLFGFSPNSVYSKALQKVKNDERVQYEVGDGMKGYGEETSRGRRRHVVHQEYVVDGVNHMRVMFYVSGKNRKANVHVEAVENINKKSKAEKKKTSRGKFDFRYIFVQMQGFPPSEPIIIVDNR